MKLERYEKELAGLKDRIELLEELIEKEKGNKNDEYPKIGETYYFISMNVIENTVKVCECEWENDKEDIYYWTYRHGSTDKAEVEWTIKHIELVNEIKKYTRPFEEGESNWWFIKEHYPKDDIFRTRLDMAWSTYKEPSSDYGFFWCENAAEDIREQFGEEYIFRFLFRPVDGNYKAVMDWLEEQEEE